MACRSVLANRHRTLYLTSSLALSSCVLVVGGSVITSIHSGIENGLRDGLAGDLQVFHAGNPPLEFTSEVPVGFLPIADPETTVQVIGRDPDVLAVALRAQASGIALADGRTAPVVLIGIDPEAEATTLHRLLPDQPRVLAEQQDALVGVAMAKRLNRTHGAGEVTILIPTSDGLFDGDVFNVKGTYASPGLPLLDEFIAFVRYDHLQALLGDEGHPGSLVVRLRNGADVGTVKTRLAASLQDAGLPASARTWDEMAGDLLGIVRVGRYIAGSGYVFVLLVVLLGVGNMQLILMLDKTHEIGLMNALGTSRTMVVSGLLAEVLLLSVVSAAGGVIVGGVVCAALGQVGIPVVSSAMAYALGGERFFPEVHMWGLATGFAVVALIGPIAAISPAMRVSRTPPAVVLRSPE